MSSIGNFVELPGNRLPYLEIDGLQLRYASATRIMISQGVARDMFNQLDIETVILDEDSPLLRLQTTFAGAGGLDTGTVANNTLYYVYLLGDQTKALIPTVVASTNDELPIFPTVNGTTYSHARMIGTFSTDSSGDIRPFSMIGNGNSRYVQFTTPPTVLNNGSATSPTAVSLNAFLPLNNFERVHLQATFTPAAPGDEALINNFTFFGIVAAVEQSVPLLTLPAQSGSDIEVEYSVTAGTLTLSVLGYELSL